MSVCAYVCRHVYHIAFSLTEIINTAFSLAKTIDTAFSLTETKNTAFSLAETKNTAFALAEITTQNLHDSHWLPSPGTSPQSDGAQSVRTTC